MRQLIVVAAVVISALFVPTAPAEASCATGSGPAGAPVMFLGTAQQERGGFTRFRVEEVQVGPDLAPEVWVRSGQPQPSWPRSVFSGSVSSSVDVDFTVGTRYVVGATRSFSTNACQASLPAAGASQSGARPPVEDGDHGADPPIGPLVRTLWVAGILVLVVVTVIILGRLRRRGRPASSA